MESRVKALESFCSSQKTVKQIGDDWSGYIQHRVTGFEERVSDLELIRLSEMWDERDGNVSVLEGALEGFRLEVVRVAKLCD